MSKQHRPRTYRTKVSALISGSDGLGGGADISYQFINQLMRPVTVINRVGARIIIPYKPTHPQAFTSSKKGLVNHGPSFIIRVKTSTTPNVFLDTTELSNDMGNRTSMEAQAHLDSLQLAEDRFARGASQTTWVEYRIPVEDFDTDGGVLFLQNLDLLLSVLPQEATPPHPHSLMGQRNRDAYDFNEELAVQGIFYGVYIRDSDGHFGQRFININGIVYAVPVLTSNPREERDGVYIISCGRAYSNFAPRRTLVEFYTFEEADEKLGLYQTYPEALSLGNPQDKFKRDYEERSQQLKNAQLRMQEERTEAERIQERERDRVKVAMIRYEAAQRELDYQNKLIAAQLERREQIFKREMQILKEITEGRGHDRREIMEVLKIVPSIITAALTFTTLYNKIKS